MKVVLDKAYPLAATADDAWHLMQDIEAVAGCMPGAKITGRIDDTHYKGTITVRLGPATMSFKGDIEVITLDAATRSLHLLGKGTDATGGSAASMDLTAAVEPAGDACRLIGKSEVEMNGKAAAIGGRLMAPASEQLLKQFVANFAARLDAIEAARASHGSSVQLDVDPQDPVRGATQRATQGDGVVEPRVVAGDVEAGMPAARTAEAQSLPAAPPAELNGFAFLWAMIRDWLRERFSPKAQGR